MTLRTTNVALPHASHLSHHFESARQQFSAAKLGMWLFIGQEVLFFGGLFCAYAVLRNSYPEVFQYCSRFLDVRWGALNTAVLLLSSFTMAIAVRAAQTGNQRQLVMFLSLTLLCAVDFLGIKYVEYTHKFRENLVWGQKFYAPPHPRLELSGAQEALAAAPIALAPGDVDLGRKLFRGTCANCHGARGETMAAQGIDLRTSSFAAGQSDGALVEFVRKGRMPTASGNKTGKWMPPRGGNNSLNDQDLTHVVAFVRTLADAAAQASMSAAANEQPFVAAWAAPPPGEPPAGLAPDLDNAPVEAPIDPRADEKCPPRAPSFFALYFCMTGLHAVHIIVGIGLIAWLLLRSAHGHFGSAYSTPVDLVGLYWHLVDLIWIFLFPLFYLVR